MIDRLNRLVRVERGEWPKLVRFGLFGFLLQMGLGVGFSVGDAAFLSHVGAEALPVVFMLTPVVMLVYTGIFSLLMVRFPIDRLVIATLVLLVVGGLLLWALLGSMEDSRPLYYGLKLYLAMWYIALYSLFWTFTDAYFDIQDAKRLFPLFAAFCALGTAAGALIVNLFAAAIPMPAFLLLWSAIALATMPLARSLARRWPQIAENDAEASGEPEGAVAQIGMLAGAFRTSRYTVALTATLFVTLLMTNLAEYQYAKVLQQGRSEADLAALFGALYAASNLFNLVVCLFVFHRLVSRLGVRNVAFILPLTYFAVFGYFFLSGGYAAAIAAFFAYHAVLTSIEYNNQNLLFNAVPSAIKRPLRTVVEGMCEPLASLVAGGFLLYAATHLDLRELSGVGVLLGAALIAVVVWLRQLYPSAMADNMRRGWLNFSAETLPFTPAAKTRLHVLAGETGTSAALAAALLDDDAPHRTIDDIESIPAVLGATPRLAPRDRRAIATTLAGLGETAVPHLVATLRDASSAHAARAVAARALAALSYAQFAAQMGMLVHDELDAAAQLTRNADRLGAGDDPACALLARAQRERAGAAVDFALELLALGGLLPNFDLLIVSLHSSNAKVRANAMEAVETGVGHELFRRIDAILRPRDRAAAVPPTGEDLIGKAAAALGSANSVEVAAALAILHDRLTPTEFARHSAPLIEPGLPASLRAQLLDLLGLASADGPGLLALVDTLRKVPHFAAATLQTLADLAGAATLADPGIPATSGTAAGYPFWIAHRDIADATARYPDLALVILRAQDGRGHVG